MRVWVVDLPLRTQPQGQELQVEAFWGDFSRACHELVRGADWTTVTKEACSGSSRAMRALQSCSTWRLGDQTLDSHNNKPLTWAS